MMTIFIKKAKERQRSLYVFPVWQNDSIVISQAIESDLNSELQKVEYIKEIANQDLTDRRTINISSMEL